MATFAQAAAAPAKSWAESSESPPGSPAKSGVWSRSNVDSNGEGLPEAVKEAPAAPAVRPRLQLQKRSVAKDTGAAPSANSSIFGAARSREQVLAEKGIDASAIDQKVEQKAATLKLSKEQEQEADACKAELAFAEKELTDANEKELPEGDLREKVETKKTELGDLLDKFAAANLVLTNTVEKEVKEAAKEGRQKFERPSERRKRQEQEAREKEDGGGDGDRRPRGGSGNNQDRERRDRDGDRRDGGERSYRANNRDSNGSSRDHNRRYNNDDGGRGGSHEKSNDAAFGNFGNRSRQERGDGGGSFERRDREDEGGY